MPVTATNPLTRNTSWRSASAATRAAKRRGLGDFRQRHDEAVEIVVVVLGLRVMAGAAVLDVVLGADAETEQRRRIDLAVRHGDDLHRPRQEARDGGERRLHAGSVEQVALVEHDEVGAGELVLEHLLDRIVVIERRVGGALARQRLDVGGDAPIRERRAVDHRDDAVHGDAALDRRPVEGLDQRLGQRETRGLDDDVLDRRPQRQDGVERRHEFVGHGAAQAAIGELDDVLLRTGIIAAAFQDFAVDADIAELVDDDGKPAAAGIGQHVADQRRLAGAEKAGDDGAGHARKRIRHQASPGKSMGGVRAMSPRLRASGRPRHGITPSVAWENSLAPSISAPAPCSASSPPNR